MLGGFSPWCIRHIILFSPEVKSIFGPLEPYLRAGVGLLLIAILWIFLKYFFSEKRDQKRRYAFFIIGGFSYSVCGLLTASLFPLFGEYKYLDMSSYSSVIWTTLAVWHVYREQEDRNRQLSELDAMKKEFINHVTHEFKSPLFAIQSAVDIFADLIADDEKNKTKKVDYLEMVRKNADRLGEFVDELLDLAAIQQSVLKLKKQDVDLVELTTRSLELLRPMADQQKTAIKIIGEPVIAHCDEGKIQQVMANLLSNAIKFAPGGDVDVMIQQSGEGVIVSVRDDGAGIASEHVAHVFSSFFHVQQKTSGFKGTGLGLAIAKGWVEAHGGEIWVKSEGEGHGSTFIFTLPKN